MNLMPMKATRTKSSLPTQLRLIAVAGLLGSLALTAAPSAAAGSAHPCTERLDEYVADMLPNHDEGCGDCTAQSHDHAIRIGVPGGPYIEIEGCQSTRASLPPYLPLPPEQEGSEG